MRKRIAVFGGSLFQDIKIVDNRYIMTENQTVISLSNCFDIDNYSMSNMTIDKALHLIKTLPFENLYNTCILAIGEADLEDCLLFRSKLEEVISYLLSLNVHPLLVSLPAQLLTNQNALHIQNCIDDVALKYNVDYIYEGETSKTVSHKVFSELDLRNALIDLC